MTTTKEQDIQRTCYMCDKPATSKEHVPPLCLFPRAKDVGGVDLRSNLIKVPSCDDHNKNKSDDDEFLMISIAGIIGNNDIGYYHNYTKVDRAIRRKHQTFLGKQVLRNRKTTVIDLENGKKMAISSGNPDYQRLVSCFEHIARGLFFFEFNRRFDGKIKMILGFIDYNDKGIQTMSQFIKRRFELEERLLEVQGDNPDVFKYQFCKPDEYGLMSLKMTFYCGTEVFAGLHPEGVEIPTNIGVELIKQDVPTVFTLGEEEFYFNLDEKENKTD